MKHGEKKTLLLSEFRDSAAGTKQGKKWISRRSFVEWLNFPEASKCMYIGNQAILYVMYIVAATVNS